MPDNEPKCTQVIDLKHGFALDVKLTFLPSLNVPVFAYGGDDMLVHMYARNPTGEFCKCHTFQGHEDWVRGIDFVTYENKHVLLASCGQDGLVRVWKVSPAASDAHAKNDKVGTENEVKVKESLLTVHTEGETQSFSVTLETVLAGHENWVYSVRWHPRTVQGNGTYSLLSASIDKTLILWEPDESSGLWIDKVRLGEVGGNSLGFYGAVLSPDGRTIFGHGFQGAFHAWKLQTAGNEQGASSWQPMVTMGGHFDEVRDIAWDPKGAYLLSCSKDQTTRLHAPWVTVNGKSWKEVARPQVHGYDMNCIAVVDSLHFVSGAEEKVLRAFEGTQNFVDNFNRICKVDLNLKQKCKELAEGASVPSLGLSNKAVFKKDLINTPSNEEEKHPKDQYPEFYFVAVDLTEPPTEENLLQNTLWTEEQKLYGHGYELFTVAVSHDCALLASACKASNQQHAGVFLWDTATWKLIGKLVFHNLTITQMAFSPDDNYLLTVSRDRSWCVYQRNTSDNSFSSIAHSDKTNAIHQRIIWSCSWSHDSQHFATASRDKKVVVWGKHDAHAKGSLGPFESRLELDTEDSATAVDFAPCLTGSKSYVIAVGLDNGSIFLYQWNESSCTVCATLRATHAHHLTVKRLKFSPCIDLANEDEINSRKIFHLASSGDDHFVCVYSISE
ncbi:elongator complex protein 2-like isoform X1 [Ornithodoros turicata]|uniref:elongator complex protein 2-like isoform X1 n=1 Tax=Ornithodoros turicata TaxID=34597 RepID=UPI0031391E30